MGNWETITSPPPRYRLETHTLTEALGRRMSYLARHRQETNEMPQLNQRDAIHYIATRQEFKASALSGKYERYTPQTGRLNNEETAQLLADFNRAGGMYVVYSYGTPIAWHNGEGWYVVTQKFSVTTSKHTNAVRHAITSELVSAN